MVPDLGSAGVAPELLEVSRVLTDARANARAFAGRPDGIPVTMAEAYRVQKCSIATWGDDVAGWKIGGVPAAYTHLFEETFLTGPIFRRSVQEVPADGPVTMPVFKDGFAAIEPEFIFQLGNQPAQDRLFIGVEIASSPIPNINDHGPTAVVSDFGNNNGLAIGPEIADWRDREGEAGVACWIAGKCVGEKRLTDFRAHPLNALEFLRGFARENGISLPAGTFVSTGAITGIHEGVAGTKAALDFGAFGSFEVELTNAEPR